MSKSRTETVSPSSTSAGYALTGWLAAPGLEDAAQRADRPVREARALHGLAARALGGGRCRLRDRLAGLRLEAQLERLQVLVLGEGPAPLVDDPERDLQVVGYAGQVEVVRRDGDADHALELAGERGGQGLLEGHGPLQERLRVVRCRDVVTAHRLRQGADQLDHDLLAQAGDLPVEALVGDLVEDLERDVDGHAVRVRARLELVRHPELQRSLAPRVRIVVLGDGLRGLADEHRALEVQEFGLVPLLVLPPAVEVGTRDDMLRDPLVVEVEEGLVVDDDVAAAGAVLQLLDLGEQLAVVREELVVRAPVALDERVPDEQLAAHLGVDAPVVHLALGDERDAVQRHLLVRHHGRLVLLPVRLAVRALQEVLGEGLDPLRLDPRVDAGPQPRRLDELGGHDEARGLLEEGGAGEDGELGVARAQVLVPSAALLGVLVRGLLHVLHPDVGEQAA